MFRSDPGIINSDESSGGMPRWLSFDNVTVGTASSPVAVTSYAHSGAETVAVGHSECPLSATKIAVLYYTSAGSTLALRIFDCASGVLVGGTAITLSSVHETKARPCVKRISDTKLIISYVTTSGVLTIKTYTVSGSTLTLDATATSTQTNTSDFTSRACLAVLSATVAIVTDVNNAGTDTLYLPVQIGGGTLAIDNTNVYTLAAATASNILNGWAIEALGDGVHFIAVQAPNSATNVSVSLMRLTAYGAAPTIRDTATGGLDSDGSYSIAVRPDIMVLSQTKMLLGLYKHNGGEFSGLMVPLTINTTTPAIDYDFTAVGNFESLMVPYGYAGGGVIQNYGGKPVIMVAGAIPRKKAASLCGNVTAMLVDGTNLMQYKTYDFLGTDHATLKDTRIIGLNANKVVISQLAPSTRYPELILLSA